MRWQVNCTKRITRVGEVAGSWRLSWELSFFSVLDLFFLHAQRQAFGWETRPITGKVQPQRPSASRTIDVARSARDPLPVHVVLVSLGRLLIISSGSLRRRLAAALLY